MLFSRNPRFRTTAKIYGFFLIIGSGCWQILMQNRNSLLEGLRHQAAIWQAGDHPFHSWHRRTYKQLQPFPEGTSPAHARLKQIEREEVLKSALIRAELGARLKVELSTSKFV
mmetsp:Transcript_29332/g.52507  ORF Transcript_29332/g.52507 Transcript_29332/m.52507 type:complete len:113 (+) Transcript_29332:866-1204(+)